jgi:hypothetical protein
MTARIYRERKETREKQININKWGKENETPVVLNSDKITYLTEISTYEGARTYKARHKFRPTWGERFQR